MQTKLTKAKLLAIPNVTEILPPELTSIASEILEPNNETEEFLLGFASCLNLFTTETIQLGLSEEVKALIIGLLQEAATSIRNRDK
jgi:hypothetical protein